MPSQGISVCFVIKNGMINGYPFWESLTSSLPLADEIIISEGFSTDGTYEAILKFQKKYGQKVKVFRCDWSKFVTEYGDVITKVSHEAMSHCSKNWIYYLQADEIIHPLNVGFLKKFVGRNPKFNSVCFSYNHFIGSWKPLPPGGAAYNQAIRMVKKSGLIYLIGDGWTFGGQIHPTFGPNGIPKPVYHFGWVFPKNIDQKNIEQVKIYPSLPEYQKKAEGSRQRIVSGYRERKGLPVPEDYDDYPCGMKRLVGAFEYTLPLEGS